MSTTEKAFSIKTRKPLDEDDLLTEEDKQPKTATAVAEDCTTRRRACKNCVCGRAEIEARQAAAEANGEKVSVDDSDAALSGPPAGGCGSCARGDAFRCAGCPYLGKPAWNTADDGKVQIDLTDDM